MKKFSLFLALFVSLVVVISCSEQKDVGVLNTLQGEWICTGEDGVTYASDSVFSVVFNTDMSCSIGRGTVAADGGMQWVVDVNYSYSVNGDLLTIRSTSDAEQVVYMKGSIDFLSSVNFVFSVSVYTIDGVNQSAMPQYAMETASNNALYGLLPGIWSSPQGGDTEVLEIYSFGSDNQELQYYLYNTQTKEYVMSVENGANYLIYGSYVVLNMPSSDDASSYYKVWVVQDTPYEQIEWYNRGVDGTVVSVELTSMVALP